MNFYSDPIDPIDHPIDPVSTPASEEKAWDAMTVNIPGWWHPDHSWSGDAANFYFRRGVGGCFCERLPAVDGVEAGSVEHLRIIF